MRTPRFKSLSLALPGGSPRRPSASRPRTLEVFDLSQRHPDLPNVVLIQGCLTDDHHVHSGVSYYGLPIRESLSTFVHPNELLDCAMAVNTTRGIGYFPITWDWQNHPLSARALS